ncbi:hypothetical protein KKE78_03035 [Patescibacteria group bacterium]|nr:hypothetical protein [Patescibacteria group bacterium]
MKKGLLIVVDGIDGSGKTTQIKLLANNLKEQRIPFETISFPRYKDNIYGELIKRYLEGEFGSIHEVNSYLMSCIFAGDRVLAKPLIEKWLSKGKLVLVNRYVSASKAHMGANLEKGKREPFFKWLDNLEYETNAIPKEDLAILLNVDPKIGQKNVAGRHRDIHEQNLKHLDEANKIYLSLAKKENNWYVVGCMKDREMRKPQDIHQELLKILKTKFNDFFRG